MTPLMQALVIDEWGGTPRLTELPIPEPGPGEVLVRVDACGVGLTVLNVMAGVLGRPQNLPRVPGHEIAGTVVARGSGVTDLAEGDRVINYFHIVCDNCDMCRKGRSTLCRHWGGYVSVHRDGGYAEYTVLPVANCFKLPDGIGAVAATAIPDAIGTPLHVVQSRARVRPGERCLVIGAAGGVGIHLVQMMTLFGGEVIAVDLSAEKLEACRRFGAAYAIDPMTTDLTEAVMALTSGRGVDVAVDLVGSEQTLNTTFDLLTAGGRMVNVTTFQGPHYHINPITLTNKELQLMGSRYVSKHELLQAIELVADGRIKPVVSETAPLSRVLELHEQLRQNRLIGRAAVVF